MAPSRRGFTDDDDELLVKYISKYNPEKRGRSGNALYQTLAENAEGKWPWSSNHSWQSWRERYKNNQSSFDYKITQYQKKHPAYAAATNGDKSQLGKRVRKKTEAGDEDGSKPKKMKRDDVEEETRMAKLDWTHIIVRAEGKGGRVVSSGGNDGDAPEERKAPSSAQSKSRILAGEPKGTDGPVSTQLYDEDGTSFQPGSSSTPISPGIGRRVRMRSGRVDVRLGEAQTQNQANHAHTENDTDKRTLDQNNSSEKTKHTNPPPGPTPTSNGSSQVESAEIHHSTVPPTPTIPSLPSVPHRPNPITSLYPDLSELPSPHIQQPPPVTIPGTFPTTGNNNNLKGKGKDETLELSSQSILVSQPVHVSQEPTPPMSATSGAHSSPRISSRGPRRRKRSASFFLPDSEDGLGVSRDGDNTGETFVVEGDEEDDEEGLMTPVPPRPKEQRRRAQDDDIFAAPSASGSRMDAAIPSTDLGRKTARPPPAVGHPSSNHAATSTRSLSSQPLSPSPLPRRHLTLARMTKAYNSRPSVRSPRPREPPRVVEGPYLSAFTDGKGRVPSGSKRRTGVDEDGMAEDDSEWPPKRSRKEKGKEVVREEKISKSKIQKKANVGGGMTGRVDGPLGMVKPTKGGETASHVRTYSLQYAQANSPHPFNKPSPVRVEHDVQKRAKANIDATRLGVNRMASVPAEEHHPFTQPTQSQAQGYVHEHEANATQEEAFRVLPHGRHVQAARGASPVAGPSRLPPSGQSHQRQISSSWNTAANSISAGNPPAGRESRRISQLTIFPPHAGERFSVEAALKKLAEQETRNRKGKGKELAASTTNIRRSERRQTFGGFSKKDAIPWIDLRATRDAKRARGSFPTTRTNMHGRNSSLATTESVQSRGSASVSFTSASSVSSSEREREERLALQVGFDTLVAHMSKNLGFTPEFIRQVWNHTGTLKKADAFLYKMRQAVEREFEHLVEEDDEGLDGDNGEEQPISGISSRRRSTDTDNTVLNPPDLPPRTRHNQETLEFVPGVNPEVVDQLDSYSPPKPTRAADYVRLVEQGRKEEAIKREMRRSSGKFHSLEDSPHKSGSRHRSRDRTSSDVGSPGTPSPPSRTKDLGSALRPKASVQSEGETVRTKVWTEEDDAILRSGDEEALWELEEKFGKGSVKRRTVELMAIDAL